MIQVTLAPHTAGEACQSSCQILPEDMQWSANSDFLLQLLLSGDSNPLFVLLPLHISLELQVTFVLNISLQLIN